MHSVGKKNFLGSASRQLNPHYGSLAPFVTMTTARSLRLYLSGDACYHGNWMPATDLYHAHEITRLVNVFVKSSANNIMQPILVSTF